MKRSNVTMLAVLASAVSLFAPFILTLYRVPLTMPGIVDFPLSGIINIILIVVFVLFSQKIVLLLKWFKFSPLIVSLVFLCGMAFSSGPGAEAVVLSFFIFPVMIMLPFIIFMVLNTIIFQVILQYRKIDTDYNLFQNEIYGLIAPLEWSLFYFLSCIGLFLLVSAVVIPLGKLGIIK